MARNQSLNRKMRDEKRRQILDSALKVFAAKGLAATKIADIVAHAGISQGLVYHYFKSKEEIFVELIRLSFEKLIEACRILESQPISAAEKIKLALTGLLENLERSDTSALHHQLIYQANVSEAIPDEAKAIISKEGRVLYEIIARIIKEGQKDGTIKEYEAQEMAVAFWTSIKGLALHKAAYGDKDKMPDPGILLNMFLK